MGETWRLIRGAGAPAENMAVDLAMAWGVGEGLAPPTLRLYWWEPPAVSLGYAQRPEAALDLSACAAAGLAVVRRPTGGRAVFHAGDLTYALALPRQGVWVGRSVAATFLQVHVAIAAGLGRLGVAAEVAGLRPPRRGAGGPLCFAAVSAHEITVGGRKLVGSAQRRFRDAILQHGSIPLTVDRAEQAALLRGDRRETAGDLGRAMVSLAEVLGGPPEREAVGGAIAWGFAETFHVRFAAGPLHTAEGALARSVAAAMVDRDGSVTASQAFSIP